MCHGRAMYRGKGGPEGQQLCPRTVVGWGRRGLPMTVGWHAEILWLQSPVFLIGYWPVTYPSPPALWYRSEEGTWPCLFYHRQGRVPTAWMEAICSGFFAGAQVAACPWPVAFKLFLRRKVGWRGGRWRLVARAAPPALHQRVNPSLPLGCGKVGGASGAMPARASAAGAAGAHRGQWGSEAPTTREQPNLREGSVPVRGHDGSVRRRSVGRSNVSGEGEQAIVCVASIVRHSFPGHDGR